ncbi:MAG TPA: acyl carrier protein [Acidimicrobiales bacterium]|nr:acyl carrier protein [Acidimicrobiales bacterium]
MGTEPSMTDEIRRVVAEHARLSVPMAEVADDDDLYVAGMTSHASVSMLIALEEAFEVEFTEDLLLQSTFQSVNAIAAAVKGLLEDKKAAELGPRP